MFISFEALNLVTYVLRDSEFVKEFPILTQVQIHGKFLNGINIIYSEYSERESSCVACSILRHVESCFPYHLCSPEVRRLIRTSEAYKKDPDLLSKVIFKYERNLDKSLVNNYRIAATLNNNYSNITTTVTTNTIVNNPIARWGRMI